MLEIIDTDLFYSNGEMMQLRYQYLICYDIEDNRARRKIAALLLDLGLRHIQKSAFWGFLSSAEINSVVTEGHNLLKRTDKLLITPVSTRSKHTYHLGHQDDEFADWPTHASI